MTYSCAIFPDLDTDLQPPRGHRSLSASLTPSDDSSQPLAPSLSPSPTSPSSPDTIELPHQKFDFPSAVISPPEGPEERERELSGSSTPTLVSESEILLKRFKAKFGAHIRNGEGGLGEDEDELDDELYEAQMRKLSHIVQKCAIRPGMRVSAFRDLQLFFVLWFGTPFWCPLLPFASFQPSLLRPHSWSRMTAVRKDTPRETETHQ